MKFRSIRKNWALFVAIITGGAAITTVSYLSSANAVFAPGN